MSAIRLFVPPCNETGRLNDDDALVYTVQDRLSCLASRNPPRTLARKPDIFTATISLLWRCFTTSRPLGLSAHLQCESRNFIPLRFSAIFPQRLKILKQNFIVCSHLSQITQLYL